MSPPSPDKMFFSALLQIRRLAIVLRISVRSQMPKLSSMRKQTLLALLELGQAIAMWPIQTDESALSILRRPSPSEPIQRSAGSCCRRTITSIGSYRRWTAPMLAIAIGRSRKTLRSKYVPLQNRESFNLLETPFLRRSPLIDCVR